VTTTDLFEQRAAAAGAALRAAFLDDEPSSAVAPPPTAGDGHAVRSARAPAADRRARPRQRRALAAAAALVIGAVSVGVLAVRAPGNEPSDVLTPPAERQTAVLSAPYLVGSGTLPDSPVLSVQEFAVPFTFRTPPRAPGERAWQYRVADLFDLGNLVSGMVLLAPTETYDPGRTWQGQTELVPAPTDAAGWAAWLDRTGHVAVTERRELRIGGAAATRFTLELGDLPPSYDGCGGGRTCVALMPMLDPQVGSASVGSGPQEGIDAETAELTVIELEGRAVLALTGGEFDSRSEWLPTLRAVIDSLRFA
jgi:hypothetical protein